MERLGPLNGIHMSRPLSRRGLLAGVATMAGGLVTRSSRAAPPPTETGLSHEGLLAGRPGFQPRTVMPLAYRSLPGFLSQRQLEAHHRRYVRAVERLETAERQLREGRLDARRYGEVRRAQVAAANGVLLHELYFGNLAPATVEVPRYLEGHMREHMGGMEPWAADFTRCASGTTGWAVLLYDPYDDRWHDAMVASEDAGTWIGANPLVVCDVGEDAFAFDYRDRDAYVKAFMAHIDWNEVARRYKAVDRM